MNSKRYSQYMYSYPHKTAYRPLKDLAFKDLASRLSGPGHGLYLHIPFCESKCGYCNLFSVTGQREGEMDAYLDAVERQLCQYEDVLSPWETEFSDFTIGGGTPLILSPPQLERAFLLIHQHLSLNSQAETIIETAPNQTTREKLKLLKDFGVTRVSMGIQSFSDPELKTLRRNHSAKKAEEMLALLMEYEFPTVNADFIYGVPGQTVKSFLLSLKKALAHKPQELFLYPLYVKHGVSLEQDLKNGLVLKEDLAFQQYLEASAFLKANGYRQDSMRRFTLGKDFPAQNTDSRENSGQPSGRPFGDCGFGTSLSVGCGGRSYLGNIHFCTPYAVDQAICLKQLKNYEETEDFTAITHGFVLSEEEIKRRYVIRHLLILPGLKLSLYKQHFHSSPLEDLPLLEEWLRKEYLMERGGYLCLTDMGMGLSDWLGPMLISPQVRSKMDEWEVFHGKTDGLIPGKLKEL